MTVTAILDDGRLCVSSGQQRVLFTQKVNRKLSTRFVRANKRSGAQAVLRLWSGLALQRMVQKQKLARCLQRLQSSVLYETTNALRRAMIRVNHKRHVFTAWREAAHFLQDSKKALGRAMQMSRDTATRQSMH